MAEKKPTIPAVDASGQTAAQLAEQAGLGQDSQGAVLDKMEQGVNPDAAVGSVLMEQQKTAPPAATEPAPVATTSEGARADAAATGEAINTATGKLETQTQSAFDKSFEILNNLAEVSKADREAAIKNIEQKQAISRADTETKQRLESGATSMSLARMGGYLGGSGSGVAYMNSLNQTHRLEVTKLESLYAEAIEKAKAAYDQKDIDLANKLVSTAQSYQQQISDTKTRVLTDAKLAMELSKMETDKYSTTLANIAASGIEPPDEYLATMDRNLGYAAGTSKGLLAVAKAEKEAQAATDALAKKEQEVKIQSSLVDMLSKMDSTQSVTIDGKEYHGTKVENEFKGYEIDKATGDVAMVSVDTTTGQATVTVQRGVLKPNVEYDIVAGADGKQWYVPKDPTKGSAVPVMVKQSGAGVNTKTLYEAYPEGNKPVGTTYGWCLEFARSISDDLDKYPAGTLDTIEAKRGIVEEGITVDNVTEGSWVLTNEDSKWGHIALITSISTDPKTGKKVAVLTESNGPGSSGKVKHTRTIVLDSANMEANGGKIMGFKKADLVDNLTGQSTQQLEVYEKPTAATEINPYTGLDKGTTTQVDSLAKLFGSEKPVIAFKTVSEAKQFVDNLKSDPNNPSNDQGLLYAFAKTMDPESVVREGEYATVQKYAQTWMDNFGFNVMRVADNVAFLTPEARKNMSDTINNKYDASLKNYKNIYDEYGRKIDKKTGKSNGTEFLTDYAKPWESESSTSSGQFTSSSGNSYNLPN